VLLISKKNWVCCTLSVLILTEKQLEIRVDANGAFDSDEALHKLNQLAVYKLHSIEQPIAKNQTDRMAALCKSTPIPIAFR